MKLFKRIVCWSAVGITTVTTLAGAAGYIWLRASLPLTEGRQTVPGLGAEATITRDSDGLVFIRAANSDDGYFALGYVHAQDRMWQMELTRRLGAGRLAEIGGERFVGQDRIMRTVGSYRLAEASLAALAPEVRGALDAYVRGVNAWLADHASKAGPEFALFMFELEPWRAADSLVWSRLMALWLSGNWRREIERGMLAAHLPPDALKRLFLPYPETAPVTVPATGQARLGAAPTTGDDTARAAALAAVMPHLPTADTEHLVASDPKSPRNRRIAITLLRQTPPPPKVGNTPKADVSSAPGKVPAALKPPAPPAAPQIAPPPVATGAGGLRLAPAKR
jgi:penicillin amidase